MSDCEALPVQVEVWPLAADTDGVWLLSGSNAWRAHAPLAADVTPDAALDAILSDADALDDMMLRHSTSWRADHAPPQAAPAGPVPDQRRVLVTQTLQLRVQFRDERR
jgi:hypothetical protein